MKFENDANDQSINHTLERFFAGLSEYAFHSQLGVADTQLVNYVSKLLVRFTKTDALHRIRQLNGQRATEVVTMMTEAQHRIGLAKREVHRHIGDFTLFMAGLFPEYLKRIRTAGLIYHKDFLVDYIKTGKRSYRIAAEFGHAPSSTGAHPAPLLFRKLSENFELCVVGLGFIRGDLDRMQDEGYRKARRLLLN